jgi:FAD binding domain
MTLQLMELAARLSGKLLLPGDREFATEIAGYNTAVVHTPHAVMVAVHAADISAAIRFANQHGLRVAVHATGHGTFVPRTDGFLISTRLLDQVGINPATRTASIGAGARWDAVIAAAATHGLAPVAGSSGNVGVVGYLLGGGLGPLARSHGFSSDYITGFTVVTGSGEVIDCHAEHHPELFWALRGGKGGLGVVVAVRLRLVELRHLYAGSLWFDTPHMDTVLRQWIDWTTDADAQVTTSVAIIRFPQIEALPPLLRGHHLLNLRFAYPGAIDQGHRLAAPLRSFAPVYHDDLSDMPAADITRIHNDPSEPGPQWLRGQLLRSIDQDFATALLAEVGSGSQSPFAAEVRHLGAATHNDCAPGSAVGGRPAAFAVAFIATDLSDMSDLPAASTRALTAVQPWACHETNINFTPVACSAEHFASAWSPTTFARLATLRERYDPSGVLAFHHC